MEVLSRFCAKIARELRLQQLKHPVPKAANYSRTWIRDKTSPKWHIQAGDFTYASSTPTRELVKCPSLRFRQAGALIFVTAGTEAQEQAVARKAEAGSSHLDLLPAKLDELIERVETKATLAPDAIVELALILQTVIKVMNRHG